jgi:ribosome-binding factor A
MSARTLRVNESIQRELSGLLRKNHQSEAVAITIAGVEVKADFSEARIFVSVTGDAALAADRLRWLADHAAEFRFALGRLVLLRRSPALVFELDTATARGNHLLGLLDALAAGKPAGDPRPAP